MAEPKVRFKQNDGSSYPAWGRTTFAEAFTAINNNTFSRDMLNYENGAVKNIHYGDILIRFGDICDIQKDSIPFVNEDVNTRKYARLKNGDIILADTAEDETVGKAIEIFNADSDEVISGLHTMACRPIMRYSSKFLGYYMNSPAFHNQLRPFMQGSKVTSIGRSNIAGTIISYPSSLDEQKDIANFLTSLDEVITESEIEIANLETEKIAVIKKIFSREIRFKRSDGSEFSEWEQKTFDELAEYKKGPFGSALKKEIFVPRCDTTVKVYEQQNAIGKDWKLERYYITSDYAKKMKSFEVHPGDIIVSCAGTIGEIYELPADAEPGIINQALMRIRINEDQVNKVFFSYIFDAMLSAEGGRISNGSALKNIPPFADMKKQVTFIPCLEEQQLISNIISDFEEAIAAAKCELELWKELKKGLLQQMFI